MTSGSGRNPTVMEGARGQLELSGKNLPAKKRENTKLNRKGREGRKGFLDKIVGATACPRP